MTALAPRSVIDFDPLALTDPWPTYAHCLALGAPVEAGDGVFWLFGYDAVRSALISPAFGVDLPFRSTRRAFGPSMVDIDGPEHKHLRRLTLSPLQDRLGSASMTDVIGRVAADLLRDLVSDASASRGAGDASVDLAARFAMLLPVRVFCWVMGLPESDAEWWFSSLRPIIDHIDQGSVNVSEVTEHRRTVIDALLSCLDEGEVDRSAVLPFLVGTEDSGVSRAAALSNAVMLMAAGTETTGLALTTLLARVLTSSELVAQLRSDPGTIPAVVRESLRIDPPLHVILRVLNRETTVGGHEFPIGTVMQLCLASANRDPSRYPDPDIWDPSRGGPTALTFGSGRHSCLGNDLAILELEVALRVLLEETTAIELVSDPAPPSGRSFRGVRHLPAVIRQEAPE